MLLQRTLLARVQLALIAVALLLTTVFGVFGNETSSAAQSVPYKVNFQGRLTDSSGNILTDGSYNVKFRLFDALSAGTNKWEEDRVFGGSDNRIIVQNGLFNIQFGDLTAISPALFSGAFPLFLEVELPTPATATCASNGCASFTEGAMTPRQPMASSPYAISADTLDGIDSAGFVQLTPSGQQTGTINVSGNITSGATGTFTTSSLSALFDSLSAVALNIGTGTASSIVLGKAGVPVSAPGGITTSNGTINTGSGSITTTGAIGGGAITGTSVAAGAGNVTGTTGSFSTSLLAALHDIASAGQLNIGTSFATSIVLGKAGVAVSAPGGVTTSNGTINTGSGTISTTGAVTSGTHALASSGAAAAPVLNFTGSPLGGIAAAATTSMVQLGGAIAGGNQAANGGTYLGINLPAAGAGSAADFLNFQKNNTVEFKVDNSGNGTLGGGLTVGTGAVAAFSTAGLLQNAAVDSSVTYSNITKVGTIGVGTWQGTAVGVLYGGTGQTTYLDGQLLIGNTTGNTLTKTTLTGTTNRLSITNGSGSITLNVDTTQFPNAVGANTILKSSGANAASWVANTQTNVCSDCATTTLGNVGSTSIATALVASTNNAQNIGSLANVWQNVFTGNLDAGTITTALTIGTATTTTAITIGRATGPAVSLPSGLTTSNGTINTGSGSITTTGAIGGGAITGTSVAAGAGNVTGTTGSFSTSLLAALHDIASPGQLNIGTSFATSIVLGKAGVAVSAPGGVTTSNGTINTGSGSITTTGALSAGGITGTSLGLGAGSFTSTGTIGAGAITGTSLSAGSGTISTTGIISGIGSGLTALNPTNLVQGTGAVTLQSAAAAAVTITSNAAATWSTTGANNLTINSGGGTLIAGANTTTLQKAGAAFAIDLNNAANATLSVTNSNASFVTNLSVDGGVTVGSGQIYAVGATTGATIAACTASQYMSSAASTGGLVTAGACATNDLQTTYNNSSSPATINETAAKGFNLVATAPPTADMLNISNAGQPVATNSVNGLGITYIGGAVPSSGSASAEHIDITPGTTNPSTWNGLHIVSNTGAGAGVALNGIKIDGPGTPLGGTETGLNITTGWDIGVNVQSGGLQLSAMANPTTNPASGDLRVYAKLVGGRTMLKALPSTGVDYVYQPSLFQQNVFMVTPGSVGGTAGALAMGAPITTSGTYTNASQANQVGGFQSQYSTGATLGTTAGFIQTLSQYYRGSTANGNNGFFAVQRILLPDATLADYTSATTGSRIWAGLSSQAAIATMVSSDAPTGDFAGFRLSGGAAETTWRFLTRNNATTTNVDTGVTVAANKEYDFYIYCKPFSATDATQNQTIYWRIDNLTDGVAPVEGSQTLTLPTAATGMRYSLAIRNISAAARLLDFQRTYIETDR